MKFLGKLMQGLCLGITGIAVYFLVFFTCMTTKVALVPLGEVSSEHLFLVKKRLEEYYFVDVEVMPTEPLPEEAFYVPRKRYRADKILDIYSFRFFWTHHKVMAITKVDISITKAGIRDYGILGLAQVRGRASVISSFRCGRKASKKKKLERLSKNALHELGHNFGLHHCDSNAKCFMSDAKGKMSNIDKEGMDLCEECKLLVEDYLRLPAIKKEP